MAQMTKPWQAIFMEMIKTQKGLFPRAVSTCICCTEDRRYHDGYIMTGDQIITFEDDKIIIAGFDSHVIADSLNGKPFHTVITMPQSNRSDVNQAMAECIISSSVIEYNEAKNRNDMVMIVSGPDVSVKNSL